MSLDFFLFSLSREGVEEDLTRVYRDLGFGQMRAAPEP